MTRGSFKNRFGWLGSNEVSPQMLSCWRIASPKKRIEIILAMLFVLLFSGHAHSQESTGLRLKQSARRSFEQGDSSKGREQLTALLATYRQSAAQDKYEWSRRLTEIAHEYLRAQELSDALKVLGEAADLALPVVADHDDGLASVSGGLYRQLVGLDAEERFETLRQWSLPTESRRTVRVLSSITPTEAPPSVFARALGERPRRDSFLIAKVGDVGGLFSTTWLLVQAASEASRLRNLATEVDKLASESVPNARLLQTLIRIVQEKQNDVLQNDLRKLAADLQNRPSPHHDLVIGAACLTQDWLQPVGETIFTAKLHQTYEHSSRLLRPFLRLALAVAIGKRFPDASPGGNSDLEMWIPSSVQESGRNAKGASRSVWLSHQDHILHLTGPRSDYLYFKYPLAGEFEFSCDAQIGGPGGTDGCIGFGGLGFGAWSAHHMFRVWDASHSLVAEFPLPFVSDKPLATFNRFSLKSTTREVTVSCNRHPTWTDTSADAASPWITLRCYGAAAPVFRNLKITGSPVIPREVKLNSLRGWSASYYSEQFSLQRNEAENEKAEESTEDSDWFLKGEVIHGVKKEFDGRVGQSRLYYLRPLLDGESISYEFQYMPGQLEVHPALGRLAFLIEPGGVRLHWMTDGDREWTGLAEGNVVVEPLSRRGPKPLPLASGEWNRVTLSLRRGSVTLSLNDTLIYQRKMEATNERTFGFYHDKNQTEARVRNVVMRGDWPEKLTKRQLDNLAALKTEPSKSDRQLLGAIFNDRHVYGSVLEVNARALALPAKQRFQYLSDWVLPNEDHATLRMALDFTPTNPPPVVAIPGAAFQPAQKESRDWQAASAEGSSATRVAVGGDLVSPAADLISCARQLNRLDELRDRIDPIAPTDDKQTRARLSMLALIAMADGNFKNANQYLEQLGELAHRGTYTSFFDREPETLAIVGAAEFAETRESGREMALDILVSQVRKQKRSGSLTWNRHIEAIAGQLRSFATSREYRQQNIRLKNWSPVSYATARTRGDGQPRPAWDVGDHQVHSATGHEWDYLYYRVPLQGDYEVECDMTSVAWETMELMVAGNWVGPWWNREKIVFGNFRQQQPLQDLDLPLASQRNQWARYRAVVEDGVCTTYFNGRMIREVPVGKDSEPWLAIRATARSHGTVRAVKISGQPTIPEQINLAKSSELAGWLPYHVNDIGPTGEWRHGQSSEEGDLFGIAKPHLAGSHKESLIRYHRPMLEDGRIEYEFFYREGAAHVHPALDRLAFMLLPGGVRIHWITDGPYDRTSLAPNNLFDEPANRRGKAMPLKFDSWNRLALTLNGDIVDLSLNGEPIYRRKLEPTNQRTFGLFHYTDRSESRVRNIVWRGDWPRELPPLANQELADNKLAFLDRSLPKLTATFQHNFGKDSLSSDLFGVSAGRAHHFEAQPGGLLVTRAGGNGYHADGIGPLLNVQGDFDVVASFEQLDPKPKETSGGIYLEVALDRDEATRCLLLLRHHYETRRSRPGVQPQYNDRRIGVVRRDRFTAQATEATSGRLRMARRGDTVYFLLAENDSPNFRFLGTQKVTKNGPGRVRLVTEAHGAGQTKVVWKSLTIHATKLAGLALSNQEQLVADLNKQRDTLPSRFVHDFAKSPFTTDRFSFWGPLPRAENKGIRLIAPGADSWTSCGIAPQLGLEGDFDITATCNDLRLAKPKPGRYSEFRLRLDFPDKARTHTNLTIIQKSDGRSEILSQIYFVDEGGNQIYRRLRLKAVDAIESLRFARRGKQLSFIYRKQGDEQDQVLSQAEVDDGPISTGKISIQLHTGGAGRQSEVMVEQLRVRAERIAPNPADRSSLLDALISQLTADLPRHALEFNGRTQYVTVPSIKYDGSHPITLEAFVTPDENGRCIIGDTQRSGIGLSVHGRNAYNVHAWNGSGYDRALSGAIASPSLRAHVAGTFDGKLLQIFVNGQLQQTTKLNGKFHPSGLPLMIGGSPSPREAGGDFPFDGIIDGVRVSKSVRYTKDFAVPKVLDRDDNTIALFQFDEGKGEQLGDSSRNQNHGEVRGAEWVTSSAVRRRAALGLAEMRQFAVPALIETLGNKNAEVQLEAIAALAMIGTDARPAIPALKAMSGSDDERVRDAATQTIRIIESQGLLKSIQNLFRQRESK